MYVRVIPVESILGKLSLVQAGDTGTIPFETSASQAEIEDLCEKYYPGGYADTSPGARQAPVRGRPRPGAGRACVGAAGMTTRDHVGLLARSYPAATAEVSGRHTRAADCNKRSINLSS